MYNLYHKVAVASVCTALGFALGANKEAKAATFTLTRISSFIIVDSNYDLLGDYAIDSFENLPVGRLGGSEVARAFYEFNIANLSLASNTVISQAIFQIRANNLSGDGVFFPQLDLFGYPTNTRLNIREDFSSGLFFGSERPSTSRPILSFNVTSLIKENIRTSTTFAALGFQMNGTGKVTLNQDANLIITTVDVAESVPEPTTILTAAVALGWGGWLKRKKSSQHNKTTP